LVACGQKTGSSSGSAGKFAAMRGGAIAAMDAAAPAPPASESIEVTASRIQQGEEKPKLAYSHSMALEMAPEKVKPRFERARDLCLNDASLHCALTHASIQLGDAQTSSPPSAEIGVRLPHDQIARYEAALLKPLEGEDKGQPILTQSTTDAEDLTFAISDGDRRLKQAMDYRDRLTVLAQHAGAKVEDLIQIEEKLSEVQSQIEELTASQKQLNLRVDTEVLNVTLSATPTIANVRSPLARAWSEAGEMLGQSTADAFTFVVSALPWIPLIAIGLWILTLLWKLVRGRLFRRSQS
ncbi:MAG TPA: DUF4349 domain-containing protein, partial [Alphaproteobacteria bacterium]|nr:DUF4349 domain-containing protein [Alphaproteobacteria bacterium]